MVVPGGSGRSAVGSASRDTEAHFAGIAVASGEWILYFIRLVGMFGALSGVASAGRI